jgi:tRNA(fMet)-specific endonuclease VapC
MNGTTSVVLDTTIVVDHLRGKSLTLENRFRETDTLYLPLTALGELFHGIFKSDFEIKGLRQIEDFVQLCAILSPSENTARYYGRISADLARAGRPIPKNDIWIAAIAREHNLPLATSDHHFSFVPGLSILNW